MPENQPKEIMLGDMKFIAPMIVKEKDTPAEQADFWIGETEMTVAQYAQFLAENPEHQKPESWDVQLRTPNRPVVYVNFLDARAAAFWLYKKYVKDNPELEGYIVTMPSEDEWVAAATGVAKGVPGGRKFPWGNQEPDRSRANYNNHVMNITDVKDYPQGATPDGVFDMAGNVWEWTRGANPDGTS